MITSIFLMAPQGGDQSIISSLLPLILIGVVFYFFMIRPQTKKAKETKKFRQSINKGDKIVTIGGIHGKVAEVKDSNVVIEVEGGNRLRVEKSAISMEYSTGQDGGGLDQKLNK